LEQTNNAVHFPKQCIIYGFANNQYFENAVHPEMQCFFSETVKMHCIFHLSNAA